MIDSYSYGGSVYSASLRYHVSVEKERPFLATVLRSTFDYGLLRLAQQSGATVFEGKKVTDVQMSPDHVSIILSDETTIQSQVVIGADGVWSIVAQKTGLHSDSYRFGLSMVNEYELGSHVIDQLCTPQRRGHLFLKVGGIAGYGWVFPKKNHINLGIGVTNASRQTQNNKINLKNVYLQFFHLLQEQNIIPADLDPGDIKGAALPSQPRKKTYAHRVLLCGDAAGLINPLTGEGIDYAMISGKLAAEVIAQAVKQHTFSERFLSEYQRRWKQRFGKDIDLLVRLSKRWGTQSENVIKYVSQDAKMSELLFDIATGNKSINALKWKLVRRYLLLRTKNIFSH
ncbi:MAG: FAD-dependent monooxygenase [Candidatus Thermoplasmatota archaeon]